jgi:1,4-alpha-glucan branching enzyme
MLKKADERCKKVKFSLDAPGANRVMLAGNFNNWKADTMPLSKAKKSTWEKELTLKPGKYEYKFVVDGKWIADPNNKNTVWNSLGSQNSVVEVI